MTSFGTLGVAGAGAWGVALAQAAASAGRRVRLWGRDAPAMRELQLHRQSRHLPGVAIADAIEATGEMTHLEDCDALLVATPAQATRETAGRIASALAKPRPLVVCAKGIELTTNLFMTEVVAEAAPHWPRAVLSGPSFAVDVAAGLPTAVTLAAEEEALSVALSAALKGPNSGSIIPPTFAASRSAARPRTCSPSPAASASASASGRARARR